MAAIAVLATASAQAATGYLRFLGESGAPSSVALYGGANKMQVAPGGTEAYALAPGDLNPQDAILHFHRGSDGQLSFADCIGDWSDGGCAVIPGEMSGYTPIEGADGFAIAPDDRDLYVVAHYADSISHFKIGAGGTLSYVDCLGDPSYGCAPMPAGETLSSPVGVTLSPDGNDAYVLTDSAVVHFKRGGDGSLTASECVGGERACTYVPTALDESDAAAGLADPRAIAVNPAGTAVYVASAGNYPVGSRTSAIAHFRRDANGTISFADCIAANAGLCRQLPPGVGSVYGAEAIGVSAGGTNVYATAEGYPYNAVTHLTVASDGSLRFGDCMGNSQLGCTPLPNGISALAYPRSLAMSPDDQSLYVEAIGDETLTHFQLDSSGRMSFASCESWSWPNCYLGIGGGTDDDSVAASPDGRNVYNMDGSVFTYARQSAPPATTGSAPTIAGMAATDVDQHNATANARVDNNSERYSVAFQYGETTSYGFWDNSVNNASNPGSAILSVSLGNLRAGTTYHYRVVVTSTAGTFYGPDTTFTTSSPTVTYPQQVGTVGTQGQLGSTSLRLISQVNPMGRPTTYWFEYGSTTSYGSRIPSTPSSAGDDLLSRDVTQLVTGLTPGATYHFRLAASRSDGTIYSDDRAITMPDASTPPPPSPAVRTGGASAVGSTGATVSGVVNPEGSTSAYHFAYSTDPNADPATWTSMPSHDAGAGTTDQSVAAGLSGLSPATTYYYRLVATRSDEQVFGGIGTFTTRSASPPPSVATGAATSVTQSGATLTGTVNPQGSSTTYHFEWGTTTSYGQRAPTSDASAGSDSTDHPESASIAGLAAGATYHFRIVATSSAGTSYGADQPFTTQSPTSPPPPPPSATTGTAASVGQDGATLRGTVNPQGSATTYRFDWGTTAAYGRSTPDRSAGSGGVDQAVEETMSSLSAGTTYHFRVVATSSGGTTTGADRTFTTAAGATSPAQTSAAPSSAAGPSPAPPGPPVAVPPQHGATGLDVSLRTNALPDLTSLLRHGLSVTLTCALRCKVSATLVLAHHRSPIARAHSSLRPNVSRRLVLSLSRKGRALLRRMSSVPLTLRLDFTSGSLHRLVTRRLEAGQPGTGLHAPSGLIGGLRRRRAR